MNPEGWGQLVSLFFRALCFLITIEIYNHFILKIKHYMNHHPTIPIIITFLQELSLKGPSFPIFFSIHLYTFTINFFKNGIINIYCYTTCFLII